MSILPALKRASVFFLLMPFRIFPRYIYQPLANALDLRSLLGYIGKSNVKIFKTTYGVEILILVNLVDNLLGAVNTDV